MMMFKDKVRQCNGPVRQGKREPWKLLYGIENYLITIISFFPSQPLPFLTFLLLFLGAFSMGIPFINSSIVGVGSPTA